MNLMIRISILFVFTVFSISSFSMYPGGTQSNIQVTNSGTVAFTQPIDVPQGAVGLEPQLAVNYTGSLQNSFMGVGWQLSGLSVISRCAATIATEGVFSGVTQTEADRYCLDGQKLISIDGEYGVQGTEYRLELDSFSKIVSNGQIDNVVSGQSPQSFVVYTRSGRIIEYGLTEQGRLQAQLNKGVQQWMIEKISDRKGNSIDFSYNSDTGFPLIDHIDYTANTAQGISPEQSVRFVYEDRLDVSLLYVAGHEIQDSKRLSSIETYSKTQLVRQYQIAYDISTSTNRSHLISITECGQNNTCLTPNKFDYTDDATGFAQHTTMPLPAPITDYTYAGEADKQGHVIQSGQLADLNGDGLMDMLQAYTDRDGVDHINAWLQEDGSWTESSDYTPPHTLFDYSPRMRGEEDERHDRLLGQLSDVNGDGLADFIVALKAPDDEDDVYKTWLNTGTGWAEDANYALPAEIMTYADVYDADLGLPSIARVGYFADLNGDRLVDFVQATRGYNEETNFKSWLNTGIGWKIDMAYKLPEFIVDTSNVDNSHRSFRHVLYGGQLRDINADGLPDLIRAFNDPDGNEVREVYINENPGWRLEASYDPPEMLMDYGDVFDATIGVGSIQEVSQLHDLNQDGLVDIVKAYRDRSGYDQVMTWLNTGFGWEESSDYALPDLLLDFSANDGYDLTKWFTAQMGELRDVNQDGKVDLIQAYTDAQEIDNLRTWLNTGTGWEESSADALPSVINDYTGMGSDDEAKRYGVRQLHFTDLNGDLVTDLVQSVEGGGLSQSQWLGQNINTDNISKFTQPTGIITQINYESALGEVYTAGELQAYPQVRLVNPGFLVSELRYSNGIGGMNTRQYRYGPLYYDQERLTNSGFAWREVNDVARERITTAHYHQNYPLLRLSHRAETKLSDGRLIIELDQEYQFDEIDQPNGLKTYVVSMAQSTDQRYDLNGVLIDTNHTVTEYDAFNNPIQVDIDFGQDIRQSFLLSYDNDETNWLLGLLENRKQTFLRPAVPSLTRETSYSYEFGSGLLIEQTIEPNGDASLQQQTTLNYNARGNLTAIDNAAVGEPIRNYQFGYDASQRLLSTMVNPLSHSIHLSYTDVCDLPTSIIDENNLLMQVSYDDLCREVQLTEPTGLTSDTSYDLSTDPYTISTHTQGRVPVTTYYDIYDREVQHDTTGFDGQTISVYTEYDAINRLARESVPVYAADPLYWRTNTYDLLHRRTQIEQFNSGITTRDYNGLINTITNPKGQVQVLERNIVDEVIRSIDADNNAMTYQYDASGSRVSSTDVMGNVFSWSYDILGRKTSSFDPNRGPLQFTYNGYGDRLTHTDAEGDVIATQYDAMARMIVRQTRDSNSYWEYDTALKGIGKLARVHDTLGFNQQYYYDAFSRRVGYDRTIAGYTFQTRNNYDAFSRVMDWNYPGDNLTVRNHYTPNGFLSSIEDITRSKTLWQTSAMDASNRYVSEVLGNGVITEHNYDTTINRTTGIVTGGGGIQNLSYQYDIIANVLNRTNGVANKTESFGYDKLNRLTSADLGDELKTVQYDAIGNITYKSDVGGYSYGGVNNGPHRLTNINWKTSDKAFRPRPEFHPKGNYLYNGQGQLQDGGEREYHWTGFDKPWRVWSKGKSVSYRYNPWFGKAMKITKPGRNLADYPNLEEDIANKGGTNHETIFYGGKGYSYILNPPHDEVEKYNIKAGTVSIVLNVNHKGHPGNNDNTGGNGKGNNKGNNGVGNCNVPPGHAKKNKKSPPGQAKKDCSDDGSTDPNNGNVNGNGPDIPPGELKKIKYESGYRYILKDHLGSTDVILDDKGKVVQRMSFDPWGASRNQDWSHSAKTVESVALSGFTGHEAMQPVGLIHMNGRVYDPILGRFTSTDPVIESVNQMQTYNRYSYVLNNPLKYTDPTGYITSQTCPLSGHNCQEVGKNGQHCYCTPISRPPPATPAPGTDWTLTDANGNILYQGQNPDFNLLDDGGFSYTDLYGGLVSVAYDPGVNVFTASYLPSWAKGIAPTEQTPWGTRYGAYGPFDLDEGSWDLGVFTDDIEYTDRPIEDVPLGIPAVPALIGSNVFQFLGARLMNTQYHDEFRDLARFLADLEDTRQALNSNTSDVDTLQNGPGYDPDTDIDNDGHSDATGLETNDPSNDGANSDDNGSGDGGYGDAGPGGFGDGNGGATI